MKNILALLIFTLASLGLFSQNNMNTGIIYGKNHAFSLTAPEGWVLDNESGVSQGLHAVFYKKGETWADAIAVMYANTASLDDRAYKTLEQLIKYDLKNFKKNYHDIIVTDEKDIVIKDSVIAQVKYLSGKSYGNFEAMAYIDAGKTGIIIVMTSRTKDGFENSLTAFKSLVQSYFFLADNVLFNK